MKKRGNLINRVAALGLSFFLALGLNTSAFNISANAEAVGVLESSATIADCVMSYYALCGSAVANVDWINTLYGSLGSSFGTLGEFAEDGLMFFEDGVWKPAEQLAENISNSSAYTSLGLDNVFNVSAEEVASGGGYAVATGASTLAGACGSVASTGLLPILGGVTAAYWGGIGIGTCIAHMLGLYGKTISNGAPITAEEAFKSVPNGASTLVNNMYVFYCTNADLYCCDYVYNNNYYFHFLYNGDPYSNVTLRYITLSNGSNSVWTSQRLNSHGRNDEMAGSYNNNANSVPKPSRHFSSRDEYNTWKNSWQNGTAIPTSKDSPDMIGENGNLNGSYDSETGKYTVPDMKPQIDPQTQSGKPLSLQDWLQFANGVQNNNNSTSPVPNNTSLFQDILDAIKGLVPTPGPTPDPSPGGETYPVPGPVPDPNPVPDPEYQPETKPQPQYTEKPTENETDITEGDPWTTPDLLDKFPFCIPRDVYRVFTKLDSGARAAPHIQWRFNPNNLIDYTFDIDFADFDSVAELLRTLELLGFIVALALATRTMILS